MIVLHPFERLIIDNVSYKCTALAGREGWEHRGGYVIVSAPTSSTVPDKFHLKSLVDCLVITAETSYRAAG